MYGKLLSLVSFCSIYANPSFKKAVVLLAELGDRCRQDFYSLTNYTLMASQTQIIHSALLEKLVLVLSNPPVLPLPPEKQKQYRHTNGGILLSRNTLLRSVDRPWMFPQHGGKGAMNNGHSILNYPWRLYSKGKGHSPPTLYLFI